MPICGCCDARNLALLRGGERQRRGDVSGGAVVGYRFGPVSASGAPLPAPREAGEVSRPPEKVSRACAGAAHPPEEVPRAPEKVSRERASAPQAPEEVPRAPEKVSRPPETRPRDGEIGVIQSISTPESMPEGALPRYTAVIGSSGLF